MTMPGTEVQPRSKGAECVFLMCAISIFDISYGIDFALAWPAQSPGPTRSQIVFTPGTDTHELNIANRH